jgi:capsular polysaccharide transport system ATP-binding protein
MTGRENAVFVARVYGADIRRTIDFVEEFAEIGDYMDVPVKTYSSGMIARVAFALSMAVEFDVYLIDESLAVGDARFQKRCEDAFAARRKNASIILVSHSMSDIKRYCDCGGVIVDGQMLMFDNTDKAIEMYNRLNR